MKERIKQYIFMALFIFCCWWILMHHVIFRMEGHRDFKVLKKAKPELYYTFYSVDGKTPREMMKIDKLRNDGIGDVLVEWGIITEEQKSNLESEFSWE